MSLERLQEIYIGEVFLNLKFCESEHSCVVNIDNLHCVSTVKTNGETSGVVSRLEAIKPNVHQFL